MAQILAAKDFFRRFGQIPIIDLLDGHDGQQVVFVVPQGDFLPEVDVRSRLHGQGDGYGEEMAVCEPHGVEYGLVVALAHKAVQR